MNFWDVTGVHQGAAVALAVVQIMSESDYRTFHPVFPKGEAHEEFDELVDDLGMVATATAEDVNLDTVISNVLAEESD